MNDQSELEGAMSPSSSQDSQLLLAAGRHPLAEHLEQGLIDRCGVTVDSGLLIGCSGGADSTALSVLTTALARRRRSVVSIPSLLHVDHGLRPESAAEAEQVSRLASRLGVTLRTVRLEMDGEGSDLCGRARRLRYSALQETACSLGLSHVVCAHHAEDRLETIIHGLCRGVGPEALANPRWCRPIGDLRLIRPLLAVSRVDLRGFCEELGLEFVDDPTNVDQETMRGSLRSLVLPHLEDRWPGAARRASAAVDRFAVAADSLEREISRRFPDGFHNRLDLSAVMSDTPGFMATLIRHWILGFARSRGFELQDRLSASFFDDLARAITDHETRPRVFECSGGLSVLLHGRALEIRVGDQE